MKEVYKKNYEGGQIVIYVTELKTFYNPGFSSIGNVAEIGLNKKDIPELIDFLQGFIE